MINFRRKCLYVKADYDISRRLISNDMYFSVSGSNETKDSSTNDGKMYILTKDIEKMKV